MYICSPIAVIKYLGGKYSGMDEKNSLNNMWLASYYTQFLHSFVVIKCHLYIKA